MKKLLSVVMVMALPLGAMAAGVERLTMTSWHLTPAANVATTYNATCAHGTYTMTVTRPPRAGAVALAVQDGTTNRRADLTETALGQLLTEPSGFGELRFACRPGRLFVFYRGATQAGEEASPVAQSAVFALSADGDLSVPPAEGITVTPVR
ncbi:hypothetical protein [Roseateles asaccharophilus]|uniref:Uncharacterized protein n=1 Tax=Roseateles asaccharophilus TaxID=582607 RepID=A0ABU2A4J3_9BURK|nr:hypothetical protein [Roseateles asaccharophilus]MDR7332064.1 hypothetical protein [Roseateles asaccharophilus]